jgi:hypothetical protein
LHERRLTAMRPKLKFLALILLLVTVMVIGCFACWHRHRISIGAVEQNPSIGAEQSALSVNVTNRSGSTLSIAANLEVFKDGAWQNASYGQTVDCGHSFNSLPGKGQRKISIPAPSDAGSYRVVTRHIRTPAGLERKLYFWCSEMKLDYPFMKVVPSYGEPFQFPLKDRK